MARLWQPLFRSRPQGHTQLTTRSLVRIGLVTWLGPTLLATATLTIWSRSVDLTDFETGQAFAIYAGLLVATFFTGLFAVPFAIFLLSLLMRIGKAGWIVPLFLAIAIPALLAAIFNIVTPGVWMLIIVVFAPIVIVHVCVLWAATRWLCPEALIP